MAEITTPYVTPIIEALKAEMDIDSSLLARLYALLVLSKGSETTMEDVHDAWSLWFEAGDGRRDHRSLVPFGQLPLQVQEYDRKYMNVIHRVAREYAGDGDA
ncbi:DUF7701 domain-containing protein (plasmid) [Nonomuraea sp. CA-143628]|uniref:DUF7701 domain-containing protein n=1 Tax=Nonomuraea sp. CA-143628 TaxID=3239997 RepID=UPI003D90A399